MTAMLRACVRVWVWVCVGVPAQAQNTAPRHLQLLYVSDVFGVKVIEKLKVEENDKGTLRPVCCFFLRDAQTHTHTQGSPAHSTGLSVGLATIRSWDRSPVRACVEAGGGSRASRASFLGK